MRLITLFSALTLSLTGTSAADEVIDKTPTPTVAPDPTQIVNLDSTITMTAGHCWGGCCGGGCGGGGGDDGCSDWQGGCGSVGCICGNLQGLIGCLIQFKLKIIEGLLGGGCGCGILQDLVSGVSNTFDALLSNKVFSEYSVNDLFNAKRSKMVDDFSDLISNTTSLVIHTAELTLVADKHSNVKEVRSSHKNIQKLVMSSQIFADRVINLIVPFSALSTQLDRRIHSKLDQLKVERGHLNKFLSVSNSTLA